MVVCDAKWGRREDLDLERCYPWQVSSGYAVDVAYFLLKTDVPNLFWVLMCRFQETTLW